jgi:small subunit ribosomal protein S20
LQLWPRFGIIPDPTFVRLNESRATGTAVPNTESAKKRVRQTSKRNARNLWRKRRIKDASGEFLKAVASGDPAAAEQAMRTAARTLDKIAAAGTIHKNTASRRKSRMAAKLATLKKGK